MCRLFGAVCADRIDHHSSLADAPRSLAALSPDHPHGWGIATHDAEAMDAGWDVQRNTACAGEDARFHALAKASRARVIVAHVRNRTVGLSSVANTHPFRRGPWVFAHNGTIEDITWVERRTSAERQQEIEGETDSERFFAYLLTAIDEAGEREGEATRRVDAALGRAVEEALGHPEIGAINFLLSDGATMYAHRFGRTLSLLEREGAAVLVASEPTTAEAWGEVPERTLLRIDGGASPRWAVISGRAAHGRR